jgi:hypothetical protein
LSLLLLTHARFLLRLGNLHDATWRPPAHRLEASSGLEREAEEVLALWDEAGSKGLDTWLELPAAYTMPEDSGGELEREYDYSPMGEKCSTTLEAGEHHDGYPILLKRLFG